MGAKLRRAATTENAIAKEIVDAAFRIHTTLGPGLLESVSMALMNFDPLGDRGSPPFEDCDSTLKLAEDVGIGTRDLKRIEVVGAPIDTAVFDFAKIRAARRGGLLKRIFG
jgi:hypothetical protein